VKSNPKKHGGPELRFRQRALCKLEQIFRVESCLVIPDLHRQVILPQVAQILLPSYASLPYEKPKCPNVALWKVRAVNGIIALLFNFRGVVSDDECQRSYW
jgi:hypothetical protein